jgi:hypothetical protein
MATTNPLRTLFEAIRRQHEREWTLPTPDALARAVASDTRVKQAVRDLSAGLTANRLSFDQWQAGVREALRRGGIDGAALVAAGAAAGLLAAGVAKSATTRLSPQAALARLEAAFTRRVVAHTQALAAGRIDVATWRAAFAAELDAYHPAAAIVGAGGSRDEAVLALGRQRAAEQRAFLDAWAAQLEQGGLPSERALASRATLYAGAAYGTASRSQAAVLGIALPVQPGDGRCRTNCRCYWQITPEAGGYRCKFVVRDDERTCPDCGLWGDLYADLFIETRTA